jgi:fructose-1,6-bisphosphatase II
VTACAIKALGGFIEGRLAPKDAEERARGEAAGLKFDTVLTADDLVTGDNTMFIATGVTDGGLVDGVRLLGDTIRTESVVLRSRSGTFRRIVSEHVAARWL